MPHAPPEGSSQKDTPVYEPHLPRSAQGTQDKRNKIRDGVISPNHIAIDTRTQIHFAQANSAASARAGSHDLTANPSGWTGFHGPKAGTPVDENNPDDNRLPE